MVGQSEGATRLTGDDSAKDMQRDAVELVLRPWSIADAVALREAIDEDVDHLRPWLSWTLEEPVSLEHTQARLAGWVRQFESGSAFRYAIQAASRPATILGGATLNSRVGPLAHDIGYWVRRSATGRGIAGAAVAALVVASFEVRQVARVVIECDTANAASAGFARHLGFDFVRPLTTFFPDGSPRPILQFEMHRDDYHARHGPDLRRRARVVSIVGQSGPLTVTETITP